MKVTSNLLKDSNDEWLVRTTESINKTNPIVDRLMDDDSVEMVIMTNDEGSPILTNVSVTGATIYGGPLHKVGVMARLTVRELDVLDDILMIRIKTKKKEIMIAPDENFSVMVIQHGREQSHKKDKK